MDTQKIWNSFSHYSPASKHSLGSIPCSLTSCSSSCSFYLIRKSFQQPLPSSLDEELSSEWLKADKTYKAAKGVFAHSLRPGFHDNRVSIAPTHTNSVIHTHKDRHMADTWSDTQLANIHAHTHRYRELLKRISCFNLHQWSLYLVYKLQLHTYSICLSVLSVLSSF